MSRSYTTKGSFASQTSGARPKRRVENPNTQQPQHGDVEQNPETSSPANNNERYQRREAYTMIAPNEDKRKKLLEVQQREEEMTRQRKEMKGKTPIKMTPKRVGGQNVSHEKVRTQQQQQTDKSPTLKALEMRQKREKWTQDKKDKEELEIQEKKSAARLQAEKNEKRTSSQKETVRRHWEEKYSNQQHHYNDNDTQGNYHQEYVHADTHAGTDDDYDDDGDDDRLVELCRMYPECNPSSLMEVLLAQGSIEGVRQLLG